MATATLSPLPVPDPPSKSSGMSILEEVAASQNHLRTRLAGALTRPPPDTPSESLPSVPLVDIESSFSGDLAAKKAIANQIRKACLTTGFFQISNHGVTDEAMAGVLKEAERFFHELSPSQKEKLHIKHSPLFRGYEPPDFSYVNPDDKGGDGSGYGQKKETKEGFNWGYEEGLDPTGGDGKYVELDGRSPVETGLGNVWPAEEDLPGFYDGIKLYYGLEEGYFDEVMTHPGGIARLLYYPGQPTLNGSTTTAHSPDSDEADKLGLGAHTDYECFTLLLSSTNPGLQILFPPSPSTSDKPLWLPCPVRPGTLTVNVADFLMRWTNGLYKSTIHRVVSKPGNGERYSVPFFFSINYDAEVRALPESVVGESRFEPMRAGEYVLERLRATTM